ncbi:MAG: c-type cytochrome [Thiohalomonadales bacterium]
MTIFPSKLFSVTLLSLALIFSNSVFSAPITLIIDSPEQARLGDAVSFDASRSTGDVPLNTYSWTVTKMGGTASAPVSQASPSYLYTFDTIGEYSVKLTVNDDAAHTLIKIITILDINSPVVMPATITISSPAGTVYQTGEIITFTSSDVTGNNNWDFGDLKNSTYNTQQDPKIRVVEFGLEGTNDKLSTITHRFLDAGTYTVTLANQTGYPDKTNSKALTSTYTKSITVEGLPIEGIPKLPEDLYDLHCANCHGLRDRDNSVPPKYTLNVNKGEFSFLAKNKPTEQQIRDAYQNVPLMSNIYKLSSTEITEMVAFINTLIPNPIPQTAGQTFTAQCSRCHGRGDGAYAVGVVNATAAQILDAIKTVPDMNTIPYDQVSLDLIAGFLDDSKPTFALLPQPTTGDGLYIMYCSYCHGLDGVGGPYVKESIAGAGLSGYMIMSEVAKKSQTNMMGRLLNKFNIAEAGLIADTLNSTGPSPEADENDHD